MTDRFIIYNAIVIIVFCILPHQQVAVFEWVDTQDVQTACLGDDATLSFQYISDVESTMSFLNSLESGKTLVACNKVQLSHCKIYPDFDQKVHVLTMSQKAAEYKFNSLDTTDEADYQLHLAGPNAIQVIKLQVFAQADLGADCYVQNEPVTHNESYQFNAKNDLSVLVKTWHNLSADIIITADRIEKMTCTSSTSCVYKLEANTEPTNIHVSVNYGICQPISTQFVVSVAGSIAPSGLAVFFIVITFVLLIILITLLVLRRYNKDPVWSRPVVNPVYGCLTKIPCKGVDHTTVTSPTGQSLTSTHNDKAERTKMLQQGPSVEANSDPTTCITIPVEEVGTQEVNISPRIADDNTPRIPLMCKVSEDEAQDVNVVPNITDATHIDMEEKPEMLKKESSHSGDSSVAANSGPTAQTVEVQDVNDQDIPTPTTVELSKSPTNNRNTEPITSNDDDCCVDNLADKMREARISSPSNVNPPRFPSPKVSGFNIPKFPPKEGNFTDHREPKKEYDGDDDDKDEKVIPDYEPERIISPLMKNVVESTAPALHGDGDSDGSL